MRPPIDKKALRAALLDRYPWLATTDHGPQTVDAGECDRCGNEARLVETCGPVAWHQLGRNCATELGYDAWCDGHHDHADDALDWLADLPPEADVVTRIWWVATGEVRLDPDLLARQLDQLALRP